MLRLAIAASVLLGLSACDRGPERVERAASLSVDAAPAPSAQPRAPVSGPPPGRPFYVGRWNVDVESCGSDDLLINQHRVATGPGECDLRNGRPAGNGWMAEPAPACTAQSRNPPLSIRFEPNGGGRMTMTVDETYGEDDITALVRCPARPALSGAAPIPGQPLYVGRWARDLEGCRDEPTLINARSISGGGVTCPLENLRAEDVYWTAIAACPAPPGRHSLRMVPHGDNAIGLIADGSGESLVRCPADWVLTR